jgi:hypothetical protein
LKVRELQCIQCPGHLFSSLPQARAVVEATEIVPGGQIGDTVTAIDDQVLEATFTVTGGPAGETEIAVDDTVVTIVEVPANPVRLGI